MRNALAARVKRSLARTPVSRELVPGQPAVSVMTSYEVSVVTADVYGAGTSANVSERTRTRNATRNVTKTAASVCQVFATFYGSKGKSDKIDLKSKTSTFERGAVDK